MSRRCAIALAALCAALAACEPTFDNAHLLDELRVLAVRAEPPEVGVGDAVVLEALVVSPRCGPVHVRIWQCPARGGMRQGCETFDDAIDLGPGTTASLSIGEDWRDRLDEAGGLSVHQVVTIVAEHDDEIARAIKRIVVSDEEIKNANPALEALLLGDEEDEGGLFAMATGGSVRVRPIVADGSVEDYELIRLDGARVPETETLFVSYYYSCGSISNLKSGSADDLDTTFRAPSEPARCSLHAILRDDRGGVDYRARELVVR